MPSQSNHIILMGFKHVGKTTIGKLLATRLQRNYIDLDLEIEKEYKKNHQETKSCRDIMKHNGESQFRQFEKEVLARILRYQVSIISLGGGTVIDKENQHLLNRFTLVHIQAPRDVVFARIMAQGKPAFFSTEENTFDAFNRLWEEREKVYEKLASFTVLNNTSREDTVEQILAKVIII